MFIHRFAGAAITAAAFGFAAIAITGTASASPADDDFLEIINSVGVEFSSRSAAIQAGHEICSEFAAGGTRQEIFAEIHRNTDWTDQQVAFLVWGAAYNYCTEYNGEAGD